MSTSVELTRRWGQNHPGTTVQVDAEQARWLVQHAYGTAAGHTAVSQGAAAPGSAGPDPRAGGDWSRQGAPETQRAERRQNNAAPVDGAPPQYNAGISPEAQQQARDARQARKAPTSGDRAGNAKDPDTTKASGSKRPSKTSDS